MSDERRAAQGQILSSRARVDDEALKDVTPVVEASWQVRVGRALAWWHAEQEARTSKRG